MVSDNAENCPVPTQQELAAGTRHNVEQERVFALPQNYLFLTGDANSALLLSQLVYWSERTTDPEGWVFKSLPDWGRELNLHRRTLEHARRRLMQLGLIETSIKQAYRCPTTHYRICRETLEHSIASMTAVHPTQSTTHSCTSQAGGNGQDVPMDLYRSAHSMCTDRTGGSVQNVQVDLYKTAHSITESTPETTSESTDRVVIARAPAECASETVPDRQLADEPEISAVMSLPANMSDGATPEKALYEILERLPAFRGHRDIARLTEVLQDYPDEADSLQFKRFVEYWRTRKLKRPWVALRNWLDRTRRTSPPPRASPPGPHRRPTMTRIPRQLPREYSPVPTYGDEVR
ncbi:MAG: hypothetical protein JW846_09225 [Dehalococcoidia bacterium]|nr:hypothetical protein [Dehalococcoidia bacterium]